MCLCVCKSARILDRGCMHVNPYGLLHSQSYAILQKRVTLFI